MPTAIESAVPYSALPPRTPQDQDAACPRCAVQYRWQGIPTASEAECPRCGDLIRPGGKSMRSAYKWVLEAPKQQPGKVTVELFKPAPIQAAKKPGKFRLPKKGAKS